MFKSKTMKDMEVGEKETLTVTLTEEHVEAFARATGDYNPLHMEQEYAEKSQFGRRVAHGVLLTGIISGMLGTKLPGLGTVAREMTAKFSGPAFIGDTLTATVELTEKREKFNLCTLNYNIVNQDGKTVVRGKAVVLPSK